MRIRAAKCGRETPFKTQKKPGLSRVFRELTVGFFASTRGGGEGQRRFAADPARRSASDRYYLTVASPD